MGVVHRMLAGAALAMLAACGPAAEPKTAGAPSACEGPKMRVCERDLAKAAAAGDVPAALVASYVKARAAQDEGDPWAKLWAELSNRRDATAAIVDARAAGAAPAATVNAAAARTIATAKLPEPEGAAGTDVLFAMAEAAGYEHVVWLGAGDGKRAFELFPRDPLEPLALGLPRVLRDDAAAAHLAKNLELAATVRRALDAAGAFKYVDAAREAAALTAQIEGREPFEEPVMRARYARALLAAAGLVLESQGKLFGGDEDGAPKAAAASSAATTATTAAPKTVPAARVAPPPADTDSLFGDLLRLRLAEDEAAEWARRGPRVLAAIAEDRRKAVIALLGPGGACGEAALPPGFDRTGDIALAPLLPGALAGARVEALAAWQTAAGLPLSAWYPRYEAAAKLVERTKLVWLEIGVLLRQRGELSGISSAGTPTYRRVTELGLRHIGALRELSMTEPEKYAATAELGLAYSPGLLADEPLRNALIDLTQATTKGKLGRAQEPDAIASSLLMGAFTGLTYPPAIQAAHYLALQSAFAAKVKGDLAAKTGWGAAGLFALDAVVRVIADLGPNLAFTAVHVVRALSDPKIAQPNIAAVVSAAARYAALAKDKPLAALVKVTAVSPERAEAREALRKAIVDMGAPGEAPAALADDVATLTDGMIAVATIVAHRKPPPPGTCADKALTSADVELTHALQKLNEVRQKILQNAKYKSGDGLWVRRARLLVMVLSDAMDFATPSKGSAPKKLALPAADVEQALSGALREWDEPGARDAIVGIYSLARFLLSRDAKAGFSGGGPYLIRALRGIGTFLRGDGAAGGVTMLDALAGASEKGADPDDLLGALVTLAKTSYAKGQTDQGDVFLLGTLLLTSMRRSAPPPEAVALAIEKQSRTRWALALFGEAFAAETTGKPNVAAFADDARKVASAQCAIARVDDVATVMDAVAQFTSGKRKEARAALDAVLARADAEGLVVPKMNYQYTEKHEKKVFTLSFGLTYGLGFVEGANTFQIGLGLSSVAERSSKLALTAASPEETATETARYYVRAAALAAAYHFLDGDAEHAAIDARRAISAIVSGVRLGARAVTDGRAKWAADSRALLALDAQLAADAGLPFLSGDLWTIVKDALPFDADDAKVDEVLAAPPLGLAGLSDAAAPLDRAKKTLRVVAAPLACTDRKVDTLAYELPACGAYPLALALRVADVVKQMPRLRKGAENDQGRCATLKSLDLFFDSLTHGAYDPDAFTKTVEGFRADGRVDEASTLLARQRKDGHCSPILVQTARTLGRSPSLLPASRADMLAVAVNCSGVDGSAELEKDLVALDEETRKLADPLRNLKLLLFVADLSLRANKPQLLLMLVRGPGFVDRFLRMHGNAVAGALLLHHAGHLLADETFDPAPTEGSYALVCKSFPSDDRRIECSDVAALRDTAKPAADRKTLAKDALDRLLRPPKTAPKPGATSPATPPSPTSPPPTPKPAPPKP